MLRWPVTNVAPHTERGTKPRRGPIVLLTLILAAGVANLNLSVANVALPTIGVAFNASQTALNLVAIGFSLGLAGSVLYLGALGDRYGRKLMLVLGLVISMSCLRTWVTVLHQFIGDHLTVFGGDSSPLMFEG
jgi:DHA2 family multidrug resistance protein-like MFS transporter